ncbi:MAG: hypothetical protein F2947_00785 [Actinobacteria bacterium]|uniref:Unannotated protein n=1 Tax=freshwater metagenome TaxID=449393 RepID=A0A6J6PJ88_9ZZZZ|nr:hypothetical protein [Actinomycetota bacterium]MSW31455.1 hypothetical protein [Actinomycetota bacterium]MSX33612.1 hypothetical protein [Actinomycetota bacterium]MSX95595.1 hypothetical protein [Actinomycetota bacterium]MSY24483.1 hypothetical protein [Actinomycetota bacterium]
MIFPDAVDAPVCLEMVRAAFEPTGGLDDLQHELIVDLARMLWGLEWTTVDFVDPSKFSTVPQSVKDQAAHLIVVLELMEHPLRPEVADSVLSFAMSLGMTMQMLADARAMANEHIAAMYLDLQRHSWYTHETLQESRHGRFRELLRSKLAYIGVIEDQTLARKWQSLLECPDGSWGKGVADFYVSHGFPFPGEKHGIYELGARHDWVHVLAGYDTDPEGELDVFAFIAAAMGDARGLVLLGITLGLFQNGSIQHVEMKRIGNARTDALGDPGAIERFARGFRRGSKCTVDVMGTVDLFAHKDMNIETARKSFGVEPI